MSSSTSLPLSTTSKQDWRTPAWFYAWLKQTYPFTLDAAASAENALEPKFYDGTPGRDGLIEPWDPVTFCNPPYRKIRPWLAKAYREATFNQVTAVLLLPARLESGWFVEFHQVASTVVISPRLAFEGGTCDAPPHGSMIMIFSGNPVSRDDQGIIEVEEIRCPK